MPRPLLTARRPALLAALLLAALATARADVPRVHANATPDGVLLRIQGASILDCEIVRPDPLRVVVVMRDTALPSGPVLARSEYVRSARVLGADVLGGAESRLVVELTSSALVASLDQAGDDTVLELRVPRAPSPAPGSAEIQPEPETTPAPKEPSRAERRQREREQEAAEEREEATEAPPQAEKEPPPPPLPPPPPPQRRARMPRPPDDMVVVPAGSFTMGVDGEGNESPRHVVEVDAFSIDRHEVTVAEWRVSPLRLPVQPEWNGGDDQPVLEITWSEAAEYCEWRGKRLPTEAEWEKAARGVDARSYPWGSQWDGDRANSGVPGDPFEMTAPVGSMPDGASPAGALDMAGNAWEWTADWYDPKTYQDPDDRDPKGPDRGSHKVARGGSFRSPLSVDVRTTVRLPVPPSARRDDVGVRCAR